VTKIKFLLQVHCGQTHPKVENALVAVAVFPPSVALSQFFGLWLAADGSDLRVFLSRFVRFKNVVCLDSFLDPPHKGEKWIIGFTASPNQTITDGTMKVEVPTPFREREETRGKGKRRVFLNQIFLDGKPGFSHSFDICSEEVNKQTIKAKRGKGRRDARRGKERGKRRESV